MLRRGGGEPGAVTFPANLFTKHLTGADAVPQKAKLVFYCKTSGFPMAFGFGAILDNEAVGDKSGISQMRSHPPSAWSITSSLRRGQAAA